MFILLPVWHESRSIPFVTSLLILINIAVFAVTWPLENRRVGVVSRDQYEESARKLVRILLDSSSGVDDAGRALLDGEKERAPVPSDRLVRYFQQVQDQPYAPALTSATRYRWDLEYPVFKSMAAAIQKNPEGSSPFRSYGFKAQEWFPGLLTHQFLHAGFLHLFFNMLFLWVVGSVLEASLGWGLCGLYLFAGAAGALAMAWRGMGPTDYMVGASGAVAGLMGYALFAAPGAKVRLVYLSLVTLMPRYGAFDAPLWFFMPLWLFQQLLMALMTAKTGSEIGYAAHLGAFAFGAAMVPASNLLNLFNFS